MDGNFAVLWSTDSIFTALKDLNLLKKYNKNQEACSILKVCFGFLKWPHFNRAYLVTECKNMSVVVFQHFISFWNKKTVLLLLYSIFFCRSDCCHQPCAAQASPCFGALAAADASRRGPRWWHPYDCCIPVSINSDMVTATGKWLLQSCPFLVS